MARKPGEKLPTNFVKIAILLYIGDDSRSTSQIRDFLKDLVRITEKRNVQKHLTELYDAAILTKDVKPGIESKYRWKNSTISFKKIINLFTENPKLVEDVLKTILKSKLESGINYKLYDLTKSVDPAKCWFDTQYARSFFTRKTLEFFIDTAFEKYSKSSHTYNLNKKQFVTVVLEGEVLDTIKILMHYSPKLVKYLVNLEDNYKDKVKDLKKKENKIYFIVLGDLIYGNYNSDYGIGFRTNFSIDQSFKTLQKEPYRINMKFTCSLPGPPVKHKPKGKQLKL